ncbi:TraR/DksA family transcriptional regulator [Undibacterium rugosum]|uniref:TraR/DksA C4-type zinc finger protein n=1 Tax=Undibacterium rugosum TaxID=2762291 RepID=A0A923KYM3_9BURK|nr:TraR/DksA C4-type zinc finger protein [Undibacterium rugosum]MBC3934655.1 TraR/DksA C4-type zinc finger protein [Undibacterium rugosum]MBR7779795.1 TraR/DksA C4-type zinc finger protein [Undibacterium rugosum]
MSLSSSQIESLKQKLDALKLRIQRDLRQHNPATHSLAAEAGDSATGDTLNHEAMSQYLHQHAEWEALQRAQARLSENIADVCKECGANIPYARLDVEPTAERCMPCQTALEADDKRLHLHTHSSM